MANLIPDAGNVKVNTAGAMDNYLRAMASTREAFAAPVDLINKIVESNERDKRAAQEQKRYETELGFKQRAEDRLLKEQAASDQYYKSLLGGPQAVGGALNTQSFVNEATKYDLTPEEIAFSNANKITTAEQARKLGNENLAKKFEGQIGLSNLSDRLYSEGALQESRVQMLERALGNVVNQGLPAPKELAAQIDQARADEQTAQEARLKANSEELANLDKERKADLKWLVGNINSGSGTANVLDENGNPVTVSTGKALQKEIAASNKSASTGIEDLQTSINKLGLSKEKKLDAIARANELVSALEAKDIPTAEAAGIVAKEMTTKENNPYLSYIGFSNMGPDANKEAIASYGNMLADRYQKLNSVPATATSLDNNSKYKAAEAFVQGSGAVTDAQIAKLTAERKALMMSPEERMVSRIDAAIAGLNPSAATGLSSVDMSKFSEGDFDMNRYLKKTTNVESSGNIKAQSPGGGSYYGLGQLNRKSVEDMGYNWNTYLNDKDTQVNALQKFTMNNIDQMKKSNIPVNDFTVYLAHNQGIEGAKQILSGKTPSKEILVNMLNQGIANDLPKIPKGRAGEGQIDKAQVMKDSTITAESLVKEYNPVDNYLRKFGKKFNVDITKQNGNVDIKPTKDETEGSMRVEPSPLEKNKLYARAQLMMTPEERAQLNRLFEDGDRAGIDELITTVTQDRDINLNKSKAITDLLNKTGNVKAYSKSTNVADNLRLDPELIKIREAASLVPENSQEFNRLQNMYNIKVDDIVNSTRGKALSQHMNRHTSSENMQALNKRLLDAIKEFPETAQNIKTRFDAEKIMALKNLIQGLPKSNNYKELKGKQIAPDGPLDYQQ